jgi:hypothetical protein
MSETIRSDNQPIISTVATKALTLLVVEDDRMSSEILLLNLEGFF